MATANEHLVAWLRDAHAMEEQAITMLTSQSGRLENYPELKSRIDRHLQETRDQAAMLERCLEQPGRRNLEHQGYQRQDHGFRTRPERSVCQ